MISALKLFYTSNYSLITCSTLGNLNSSLLIALILVLERVEKEIIYY